MIAAGFHGHGQFIRPAKSRNEQWDQDRQHGFGPFDQVAAFKIGAPGHLGLADLIRFLHKRGNESERNGHHHGQLMSGKFQSLQGGQEFFQPVGQGNGGSGQGHQRSAGFREGSVDRVVQVLLVQFLQQSDCLKLFRP